MCRKRRCSFCHRCVLQEVFDCRVGWTAQPPGLFASLFQLAPPVFSLHLEYTHTRTVRALFHPLGAQHRVHYIPRFFTNRLCPGAVAIPVALVCFFLVLVSLRHMLRDRYISRSASPTLMQRHPFPVFIQYLNHVGSYTQRHFLPEQRVGR